MKLRHSVTFTLLLFLSISASSVLADVVDRVRVIIPPQSGPAMTNIADILARQITKRCDAQLVTSGADSFKIELAVEPGIGTDGFRIADGPGDSVCITGNDSRGLLFGVGKFLRTSRYDRGGFMPSTWRGTSKPDKPVRGIYFATHFNNFYHDAPVEEVQSYVEELELW